MISREDVELMLKTQRESYNDSLSHLRASFENRISKLEKDLFDSRVEIESLKSTNESFKTSIAELITDSQNLKPIVVNSEATQKSTAARIDYLEDQSRRNNLRFDGLHEDNGENWEQSTKKVQDLLSQKLGFENSISIERAHRVGKINPQKPRTIVAKFLNFNDKQNIIRNSHKLRGSNVFINEDLSLASLAKRREQLPQLKEARSRGKIAYFVHTKLVVKDRLLRSSSVESGAVGGASAEVESGVVGGNLVESKSDPPTSQRSLRNQNFPPLSKPRGGRGRQTAGGAK